LHRALLRLSGTQAESGGIRMEKIPRNTVIELDIDSLAYGARGVARLDDFVWFVDGALPGQRIRARVLRMKKNYGEARLDQVLKPSPHQVNPPCPWFSACGGCRLQDLDYDIQVLSKTRQLQDLLKRIGKVTVDNILPVIPATSIYRYRNKMEFTFSNRRWILPDEPPGVSSNFALGLHPAGRHDKILDISNCLLQSETAGHLLRQIREMASGSGLPPYDVKSHKGFWRFLVLREGFRTGDMMVNIITSGEGGPAGAEFISGMAGRITSEATGTTTVLHSITDRKAEVAYGESERILTGPGKIMEKIDDCRFEISPNAFFQTNTLQAELLFRTIMSLAAFRGDETVYDLYCGTGAIGIYLAPAVKRVTGIEVVAAAVADARRNITLNQTGNMDIFQGDMRDVLGCSGELPERFGKPDVIILDPPRGGPHPKTIRELLKLDVPKLIYVSCNPAILARDLDILCSDMYHPSVIQPIDMFPHTSHIEVVTVLEKQGE